MRGRGARERAVQGQQNYGHEGVPDAGNAGSLCQAASMSCGAEPPESPALRQRLDRAFEGRTPQQQHILRGLHNGQHVDVAQQAILAREAGVQQKAVRQVYGMAQC